jgi:NitT/TauT family transport system permease protein
MSDRGSVDVIPQGSPDENRLANATVIQESYVETSGKIAVEKRAISKSVVRARAGLIAIQLAILVVVLLLWEYGAGDPSKGFTLVDQFYVGSPHEAWQGLQEWQRTGQLWSNAWVTLTEAFVGFMIGALAGMVAGFFLGIMPRIERTLSPFVTGLYAIPRLALAPLFVLWFGLGHSSKIALVVVMVFFLVFYNTLSGVREVDEGLLNVLRIMNASRWQVHARVTLPSISAWVITGLRISVPQAFVAAVAAEMLASKDGLGMLIQRSSSQFSPSKMFAAIAVSVVLALLLNKGVALVARYALRWRSDDNSFRNR